MVFKDSRFAKPSASSAGPTEHLYIAGVGDQLGTSKDALLAFFGKYGALQAADGEEGIHMPEDAHHLQVHYAALAKDKCPPEPEDTASTEHVHIPGVLLVEDFLSLAEEEQLLGHVDAQEWQLSLTRRVQHYGYRFNYRTLMVDYLRPCEPIPDSMGLITERISDLCAVQGLTEGIRINQLTVNEYTPGQGIGPHIDTEACFGPVLFVVNAGAAIVMTLAKGAEHKHIHLPRRSLLVLSDAARYEYTHSIANRKNDKINSVVHRRGRRVSFTFRHVLHAQLPSQLPALATVPADQQALLLEEAHVHEVYQQIAAHWHHTRGKRKVHWARVTQFLQSLSPGALVADVGCGDGKYFGINPNIQVIGCDYSQNLLTVSKLDAHESFVCDALHLPYHDNTFDAIICIAVLHHISTRDRRLQMLSELIRVTCDGGHIFIQAWAQEQEAGSKHAFPTQDIFVPWKLNKRFALDGQALGADQDELIVYQRYCHVYKENELEDLLSCLPGVRIEERGYDHGNWFLHLIKRKDDRLGEAQCSNRGGGIPNVVMRKADL